ncbi:hypothetical protein Tco_0050444 [Tanacetum coccineum]
MSIRPWAPAPFLSEEVAERFPSYVGGSMRSRATGIRQRDALPSPIHETEMPEICLPLRKRPCRTTPGPGYEVGESSTAGAARQVGPTTARADLYGFADMATDRRRQTVISDLLKADYRRQRQLVEALKIVKSLKTQMIELQRQQGPAKDPAEPELPEEASSSS